MNLNSHNKVMRAGFTILRCDDYPQPRIKHKTAGAIEWSTLQNYPSKAARDRAFKALLENENYIED